MLGIATLNGPNLVILDEPTNHLDIDSRAALIEAINDYAGAVVLISHDRYLIEACADRLWLVGGGTVAPFDGDLDDYRNKVLSDRRREPGDGDARGNGSERASRTEARRAAADQRAGLAPLRAQVAKAEKAVGRWTQEIERIDGMLAAPSLYADPAKATKLAKARTKAVEELAAAEAEWLSVSTEFEAASA